MEMPEGWIKRQEWAAKVKNYSDIDLAATGYDYDEILELIKEMSEALNEIAGDYPQSSPYIDSDMQEIAYPVIKKFKEWK